MATAFDALQAEDKQRLADANRQFMAMFEFVPQDEFNADLAEHVEALEAGAERSAVQERAEAAAWGQSVGAAASSYAPVFSDQPVDTAPVDIPSPAGWADWPTGL